MVSNYIRKSVSVAVLAAAIGLTLPGTNGATDQNTAPNVTYTASGKFASTPTQGADTLRLAGEPFTISIVANAASVPVHHGPNWALMGPFKMTGTVHSGLLGPTPINIVSNAASILQLVGPDYDIFQTAFPVDVVGIQLTINALIYLPPGTITTPLIHPFASVDTDPGNASVTYTNGSDATTLPVASGTLVATIATGGSVTRAFVRSHSNACDHPAVDHEMDREKVHPCREAVSTRDIVERLGKKNEAATVNYKA